MTRITYHTCVVTSKLKDVAGSSGKNTDKNKGMFHTVMGSS